MAMWSMLGERPVDACYWESFGKGWFGDASSHLKLENVTKLEGDYGVLPDFSKTNKDHDIMFTFNGTTSGVRVPADVAIPADREARAHTHMHMHVLARVHASPRRPARVACARVHVCV
jgi:phosphoserine aminotransferase